MKNLTTLSIALLFSAGSAFAQNNDADVSQTGNDNEATVSQIGSYNNVNLEQVHTYSNGILGINIADIEQVGSGNTADVYQRNRGQFASTGFNNVLDLLQEGTENSAVIHQGIARGNDIQMSQLGTSNVADISQHQGGKLSGYGSEERSVQSGEGNELHLNMGNFNRAGVTQEGNFNFAEISQNSFSNDRLQLLQEGDDNEVLLTQSGGTTDIQQTGLGENILNGLAGLGSTANQLGGASMAVLQDGLSNLLFIGQDGESNASVLQSGDFNMATVDQVGAHSASVSQLGNSNTATVSQN